MRDFHSSLLTITISLLLILQAHLSSSAQICAPSSNYYRVSDDQSSGASWNPTVQTAVAGAILDACNKSPDNIKNGFNATALGWYATFSGCGDPNTKCTDIGGQRQRNGDMSGGDIAQMVTSCIDKFPGWAPGDAYVLTQSPDGNFYGGAFEHSSGKSAEDYHPCGGLVVAAGNGQFFGGGV